MCCLDRIQNVTHLILDKEDARPSKVENQLGVVQSEPLCCRVPGRAMSVL